MARTCTAPCWYRYRTKAMVRSMCHVSRKCAFMKGKQAYNYAGHSARYPLSALCPMAQLFGPGHSWNECLGASRSSRSRGFSVTSSCAPAQCWGSVGWTAVDTAQRSTALTAHLLKRPLLKAATSYYAAMLVGGGRLCKISHAPPQNAKAKARAVATAVSPRVAQAVCLEWTCGCSDEDALTTFS